MDELYTDLNDELLDGVSGGALGSKVVKHKVVKGDTLWALSRRFKTTIDEIMARNPIIKRKNLIQIGWVLEIPDNR